MRCVYCKQFIPNNGSPDLVGQVEYNNCLLELYTGQGLILCLIITDGEDGQEDAQAFHLKCYSKALNWDANAKVVWELFWNPERMR